MLFCRQKRRGSKGPLSPTGSGVPPASAAGGTSIELESKSSGIPPASPLKKDSFKEAKFYDANSTNLPVYGKRLGDADYIEGPMEAEPQVRSCPVLSSMCQLSDGCKAVPARAAPLYSV